MPITQQSIIELMKEARAHERYGTGLRNFIFSYFENVASRYPNNKELIEVFRSLVYQVRIIEKPDDRCIWKNEHHYGRKAKVNDRMRERQTIARRMAGVPTADEALAILQARNELRRMGLPTTNEFSERPKILDGISDPFAAIGHTPELIPTYRERPPAPSRPDLIIPDDTDEPPLEFDLPPGATLGENNLNIPLDMGQAPSEDDGPLNEGE